MFLFIIVQCKVNFVGPPVPCIIHKSCRPNSPLYKLNKLYRKEEGVEKPFYTTLSCFTNQSNKKYNIEKYNKIIGT